MSTKQPDPLVDALRRRTEHQNDRIEELEETINQLEADVEMLLAEIAEVSE